MKMCLTSDNNVNRINLEMTNLAFRVDLGDFERTRVEIRLLSWINKISVNKIKFDKIKIQKFLQFLEFSLRSFDHKIQFLAENSYLSK